MEAQPAVPELVAHHRPGAGKGGGARCVEAGQLDPLIVPEDDTVVNVKKESRDFRRLRIRGGGGYYLGKSPAD